MPEAGPGSEQTEKDAAGAGAILVLQESEGGRKALEGVMSHQDSSLTDEVTTALLLKSLKVEEETIYSESFV